MISARSSKAVVRQISAASSRRGFATQAPTSASASSISFEAANASGLKFASRDLPGPTATISLVSKAGTRYSPIPGLSEGLEKFAFRNTFRRSALRIVREVELLGADVSSSYNRESVVFSARFLKEHLPYFVELLAETSSATKYQDHEFSEQVQPVAHAAQVKHFSNSKAVALDAAHTVAFHHGLGAPIVSQTAPLGRGITAEGIAEFAQTAFAQPNIAVVGSGVDSGAMNKWVNEFFGSVRAGSETASLKSQYFGGQQRIESASGNTIVIAFPGSSSSSGQAYKPELQVLATALGGSSNIKWATGFSLLSKVSAQFPSVSISTSNLGYSDAGLFTITISGDPASVSSAAKEVVSTVKAVAANGLDKEILDKAIAYSKFAVHESEAEGASATVNAAYSLVHSGAVVEAASVAQKIAGVTSAQIQAAAKSFVGGKASFVAVGDLGQLAYAEDLGLVV